MMKLLTEQLLLLVMIAVTHTAAEYACNYTYINMMCDVDSDDYELMQDDYGNSTDNNCTVVITDDNACTSAAIACIEGLAQVNNIEYMIDCNSSRTPRFATILIIAGSTGGGCCVLLLCCILWVICCGCYIKRRRSKTWEVPDDVTELRDNDYIHSETRSIPAGDVPPPLPGSNVPPPPPPPPPPNSDAHPHPPSHNVPIPPPLPGNASPITSGNKQPILPKNISASTNVPPPPLLPGLHLPPSLPNSTHPLSSTPSITSSPLPRTHPPAPHQPLAMTEHMLELTSEAVLPPSSPPPPNMVVEDIYDVGISISDDDEDTKPNDYINCSNFKKALSPDYVNYNPSKPMMIAEPYTDVGYRRHRPSRPKDEHDEYVEMSLSGTPQQNLYI